MVALVVAVGTCFGIGLGMLMVPASLSQGWRVGRRGPHSSPVSGIGSSAGFSRPAFFARISGRQWGAAFAVGAATGALTGWPIAAPIAGIAILALPSTIAQLSTKAAIDRIEAVATWTEMLQGTLAASSGITEAIVATGPGAPAAIRPAVVSLSSRLRAGVPPAAALRRFADDVDDASADRVVCSLILATSSPAQRLGDLLVALADSTRQEVGLRLRVETARSSVRSGIRTVVAFSLAFAACLVVFARSYLAPYATMEGQAVLAAVSALYASSIALMVALARPPAPVRLVGASERAS